MKKSRRIIVVLVLALVLSVSVYAAQESEHIIEAVCPECDMFDLFDKCNNDLYVDDMTSHTYGGDNICFVSWIYSSGECSCNNCGYVDYYYDDHLCWESHSSCGDGNVPWCSFGDTVGGPDW